MRQALLPFVPALAVCVGVPALALSVAATARADAPSPLTVRSPAFQAGGPIPQQYSCSGAGELPLLEWRGVPDGTRSIAVIVDDPDAPRGDFVHLVAYDLPPDARTLPSVGVLRHPGGEVGALGLNSTGRVGWTPICPPAGQHHYRFTVYALDRRLELRRPSARDVERAMSGHVLARGELVGTFQR